MKDIESLAIVIQILIDYKIDYDLLLYVIGRLELRDEERLFYEDLAGEVYSEMI